MRTSKLLELLYNRNMAFALSFVILTFSLQLYHADADISVVFVMAKHLEQQLVDIKKDVEDNSNRCKYHEL